MTVPADLQNWIDAFTTAVRERDFVAGQRLFSPTVRAFGTVVHEANGLQWLHDGQWSVVWPSTDRFCFLPGTLRCQLDTHRSTAILTGLWSSHRISDGGLRTGRATLVLERTGDTWIASHSHFSVTPADGGQLA